MNKPKLIAVERFGKLTVRYWSMPKGDYGLSFRVYQRETDITDGCDTIEDAKRLARASLHHFSEQRRARLN